MSNDYERGWRDGVEVAAREAYKVGICPPSPLNGTIMGTILDAIRALTPPCTDCHGRGQIDTGPATWNCPQCKGTGEWRCGCGDKHRCSCKEER